MTKLKFKQLDDSQRSVDLRSLSIGEVYRTAHLEPLFMRVSLERPWKAGRVPAANLQTGHICWHTADAPVFPVRAEVQWRAHAT